MKLKDYPIYLEKDERLYPLVNIATGIRWLGHKIDRLPKRYQSKNIVHKTYLMVLNIIILGTKKGEDHAKKVYRYYNDTPNKPVNSLTDRSQSIFTDLYDDEFYFMQSYNPYCDKGS